MPVSLKFDDNAVSRAEVVQMLYWLCNRTPRAVINRNRFLRTWWRHQMQQDAERELTEAARVKAQQKAGFAKLRKAALAKLTPAERKALRL